MPRPWVLRSQEQRWWDYNTLAGTDYSHWHSCMADLPSVPVTVRVTPNRILRPNGGRQGREGTTASTRGQVKAMDGENVNSVVIENHHQLSRFINFLISVSFFISSSTS